MGGHAELARQPEVLDADVGLGAHGRDAGHGGARGARALEVGLGADPGQDGDRDLGALDHLAAADRSSASECSGRAVLDRARPQAVAVADGDGPHAGPIERFGDGSHLVDPVTMGDRVEPSRSVVSTTRTVVARRSSPCGVQFGDPHGGRGHDVEVAGVRGQVVARALDLDHHRRQAVGDQRRGRQPVSGDVLGDPLDGVGAASPIASGSASPTSA